MENNLAAILIAFVEGHCLIMYCNEKQRSAYIRDGIIAETVTCAAQAIPDGFDVNTIFIDFFGDIKPFFTVVDKA